MTERPKKEKKPSRTGAFVAGVVVGAFAGAVTALLLLDDEPDEDPADDDSAAPPDRSTARPSRAPREDDGDRLPN